MKMMSKFFHPVRKVYTYDMPENVIIGRIKAIFDKPVSRWSRGDAEGYFLSSDTFTFRFIAGSSTNALTLGRLTGKVIGTKNGTEIILETTPSLPILPVFLFFGGVACLISFINTTDWKYLLFSACFFGAGAILFRKLIEIGRAGILERYYLYIHKELVKN